MNIEFCNRVQIYLMHQVERVDNGLVIPKDGEVPLVINVQDFDVAPAANDSSSSLLTNTSISFYADKISRELADNFKIKRSAIVQLKKSNGDPVALGSFEYPAVIIFSPHLNTDIFRVEHKQPSYI